MTLPDPSYTGGEWESEQLMENTDHQEYTLEEAVTAAKPSQRQLENERISVNAKK